MEIYVLDSEYTHLGMLDEYEEVVWQKKYNDIGECLIKVPCNEMHFALLRKDNYLYRYDDDMFCKVESIELQTDVEEGDYLIVTAYDICRILAGRIVRWDIVYSGTVAGFIEKLMQDNVINPAQSQRKISNFEFEADTSNGNFTETINVGKEEAITQDLLQLIITTCKAYSYGFRVRYELETGKLVFSLYKGKDKATLNSEEYVEFSPEFANILSSSYKTDDSNYKNVVYVGYKGEDEQTYLLSIYKGDTEPQGEARREVYVDGTGTSRDIDIDALQAIFNGNVKRYPATQGAEVTGYYYLLVNGEEQKVATFEVTTTDGEKTEKITVTDYTYLLLIRSLGENELVSREKTEEFAGEVDTVDSYEYKKDYNLGDIVKVRNEYGLEADARIVEIMESDDLDNGYAVEPVFEYIG